MVFRLIRWYTPRKLEDKASNMLNIVGKATSINVRKVLWTCTELALPYTRVDTAADLSALNPNALVPVLVDGDLILWESNTICRYLATAYGDGSATGLLPRAAAARARVEQWMDWQATDLNSAWRYAFMALVRRSAAHADSAQVDASAASWQRHMGILARQLEQTGAYVAGATFSLADIVLGLSVNRWLMTPLPRPEHAAIAAYVERLSARPGHRAFCANGTP
jgi:glutathione S-transferase